MGAVVGFEIVAVGGDALLKALANWVETPQIGGRLEALDKEREIAARLAVGGEQGAVDALKLRATGRHGTQPIDEAIHRRQDLARHRVPVVRQAGGAVGALKGVDHLAVEAIGLLGGGGVGEDRRLCALIFGAAGPVGVDAAAASGAEEGAKYHGDERPGAMRRPTTVACSLRDWHDLSSPRWPRGPATRRMVAQPGASIKPRDLQLQICDPHSPRLWGARREKRAMATATAAFQGEARRAVGGRTVRGHRLRYCLLALVTVGSACTDSQGGGSAALPRDGAWQGPHVRFAVEAGRVHGVVIESLSCGEASALRTFGGAVPGEALTGIGAPFVIAQAAQTLEGRFVGPTAAQGVLRLGDAGSGCTVVEVWTADWVAPPATQGGTGGGAGGGATGSIDWSGASSGDVHPGPSREAPAPRLAPAALGAQRLAALSRLDAVRAAVGLGPVAGDDAAHHAAQGHAEFYVKHAAKYTNSKLNPHSQDKSFGDGFTGTGFFDRLKAAGFGGTPSSEVMAFTGSGVAAVDGWMETVYHRLPLIDPRSALVGVGIASAGGSHTEVMDFGAGGEPEGAPIVVYPWPGMKDVPRSWLGNEGPQPPPPPEGYPSGPVITARLPAGATLKGHSLRTDDGAELPHVLLTPAVDPNLKAFDGRAIALYAHKPLTGGAWHEVELRFEAQGALRTLRWRFATRP